jgi:uncharacterized protein (TIGR00266 family)
VVQNDESLQKGGFEMSASKQWYVVIVGHQVGPLSTDDVLAQIRSGNVQRTTLTFTSGMTDWAPISTVAEFASLFGNAAVAPSVIPRPPGRTSEEIDFKIFGNDLQFVEVELDPGESAVSEAGAMMYMTQGIQMNTVFGDGSGTAGSGIMDRLIGAGKRLLTGAGMFMTIYSNLGQGKQRVAFAAPFPGRIVPMDLASLGGELICQKDSFLCAARGVSIGIAFQRRMGVGLFGGEGFIMQRLQGDGLVFVHAGGMIHSLDLGPNESLRVDAGCIVALQPGIDFDIQFVGGIKSALFGGEGLFFANLKGPGKVWLQSLPLSRLADRIYKAIPGMVQGRKGEGSILDNVGLGSLVGGN